MKPNKSKNTQYLSIINQCGENEEKSPSPKIGLNNQQVQKNEVQRNLILIKQMTEDDFQVNEERMKIIVEKTKNIVESRKNEQSQNIQSIPRKIDMVLQMIRVMNINKEKMKLEIDRTLEYMKQQREKQKTRQKQFSEKMEQKKLIFDDMNEKIKNKAQSVAALIEKVLKKQQQKKAQMQILERKRRQVEHLKTSITKNRILYQTKKQSIIQLQIQKQQKTQNLQQSYYFKRYLNNQYQSAKGNIRVYCRIRPSQKNNVQPFYTINNGDINFTIPKQMLKSNNSKREFTYSFEQIFENSSQKRIFQEFQPLIDGVLDGKNVCIFAYGQTGSGKTYTMQGYEEENGIIPRSIQKLFDEIKYLQKFDWIYSIAIECVEIYNDEVRDLFGKKKQALTSIKVTTTEQINQLLETANQNRKVAGTNCNERSSRSHLIFMIKLVGKNEKKSKNLIQSCLCLVDLAGSQRISNSKVQGQRLKQANQINKSLSSLRLVIQSMVQKSGHIPFRNCKLTTVLQPYLSGQSRTIMMMCISPDVSDWSQTQTSLSFSQNVKKVVITKN